MKTLRSRDALLEMSVPLCRELYLFMLTSPCNKKAPPYRKALNAYSTPPAVSSLCFSLLTDSRNHRLCCKAMAGGNAGGFNTWSCVKRQLPDTINCSALFFFSGQFVSKAWGLLFKLSLKLLSLALRKVIYLHRGGWSLDTKITQDNLPFSVLPKRSLLKAFIERSPSTDLWAGRQHKWISA